MTGAVEAMVVDVQCIMQALPELASKLPHQDHHHLAQGQDHRRDAHRVRRAPRARDRQARSSRVAIDNYPEPRSRCTSRTCRCDVVPGFSHEYINYMLGGTYRASFRPLNDAIMSGRIARRGGRRRLQQPAQHAGRRRTTTSCRNCSSNDVLVVQTGCGAHRQRQVRLPAGRGRAWSTPARACARSAKRSASRRCCTWARAWTTRASSPC